MEATYVYNPDGLIDITIRFPEKEVEKSFSMKAEMDPEEIEASKARLDQAWQESDYLDDVEALMEAAKREMEDGTVPPDKEEELQRLIDDMKRALATNDGDRVRELDEGITDLLFEVG